jgi:hypothetical protein
MLPPIDEAVFQSNPEFATLYKTLTTVILNPDGSTKNEPDAKARSVVREVSYHAGKDNYLKASDSWSWSRN